MKTKIEHTLTAVSDDALEQVNGGHWRRGGWGWGGGGVNPYLYAAMMARAAQPSVSYSYYGYPPGYYGYPGYGYYGYGY